MAERVLDINPSCQVRAITKQYNEADKAYFLDTAYDYIIDAIDLVSCKLSLIENAHRLGFPFSALWAPATSWILPLSGLQTSSKPPSVPWRGSYERN